MSYCDACQGTGEVVTDWDRYLEARPGDIGDEAVAPCPECDGTGQLMTMEEALEEDRKKLEAQGADAGVTWNDLEIPF